MIRSLPAQPISIRKTTKDQEKSRKPLWVSQTNASAMFDNHKTFLLWLNRISRPFTYSHCVICFLCPVHLISTYYMCKGSQAFFILITHQSTRSEDLITWYIIVCVIVNCKMTPCYFLCSWYTLLTCMISPFTTCSYLALSWVTVPSFWTASSRMTWREIGTLQSVSTAGKKTPWQLKD